ncbi:hypothetical protein SODALDRAFT_332002 [Sodiomyces alkalinus F11]|uniref:mRNA splicing factor RNA helicase n=1 Tax=Sodiomyces alkalinus (strain CBS 110278 / VKM F-3762 / F11) TaxID=1314773 RepID=A0A3N2PZC0_SODAK|nr:hypothetical protein SODALDRAFT_332002 [Sodiomyces alkalinus F11]ROT39870.1 hypothetical protein SODALDRAFT_332002 [Sodiomyces alkalinus F11]
MASTSEEQSPTIPPVLFRSNRKRKPGYRQRPESQDIDIKDTTTSPEPSSTPADRNLPTESTEPRLPTDPPTALTQAQVDDDPDPSSQSIAEALRLRNLRKSRLKGVGFRPQGSQDGRNARDDDANQERSLVQGNQDGDAVDLGIHGRFAPQTGIVGELVNKHMMEYIESKLSNRRAAAAQTTAAMDQEHASFDPSSSGHEPRSPGTVIPSIETKRDPRVAAIRGRLMEVDLGEEARARNIALTERARRRLASLAADDHSPSPGVTDDAAATAAAEAGDDPQGLNGSRAKKERFGSDGKSRRSRQRRASEDLERDRLVEEFLRENKLDVYDLPDQEEDPKQNAGKDDENLGADDRLVEAFRREFLEAMSLRRRQHQQRRRRPANPAGSYNSRVEKGEVLRGPKLGGSRNERAAMRDLLLQQEKEKRQATKR